LLQAAVLAVLGDAVPVYSLALWHGFNLPLLMSVIALLGGIVLYVLRKPLFVYHERLPSYDALQIFEKLLQKFIGLTRVALRKFEQDSLRSYVLWVIAATVIVIAWPLSRLAQLSGELRLSSIDFTAVFYLLIAGVAALLVVSWHAQRLRAIIALGVVGLMSALVFARFSAPDLALTQLAVEVVSTLLLLLALNFLPQVAAIEARVGQRWRDLLLAGLVGMCIATLAYAVMTRPYDSIAQYFIDHSVPDGGGHNVVNVILVDFRGFDTLGEITVLLIAAVAISAISSGFKLSRFKSNGSNSPRSDESISTGMTRQAARTDNDIQLTVLLRLLLPLILLLAVYLLLRGHNSPGGGFVAGLVTAVALILQYLVVGEHWITLRSRAIYLRLAAGGVALALLTGIASWLFDAPFLTSAFAHGQLPWLGEFEIASAMVFDLGVYAAVVGATLTILSRLSGIDNSNNDTLVRETTARPPAAAEDA
jgi:multicomponent K+:H+ antiporter subunit A